jgi:ATPase family AAA domain-containing protein 3A/B
LSQETCLKRAAKVTEGFSGRELAKLMASVQAAAYGTPNATLTSQVFDHTLQAKLRQHEMRQRLEQGLAVV